jgi:hypothetical protein
MNFRLVTFLVIILCVKALFRHPVILAMVITLFALMTTSSAQAGTLPEQAAMVSSGLLFDYLSWTLNAAWQKIELGSLGMPDYLTHEQQKIVVYDYLQVTRAIEAVEADLDRLYADPAVADKATAARDLRIQLEDLTRRQKDLAPFAEAVIQDQVASAVAELGLITGGQPIPSVLYHISPLPLALILSPREKIQQEGNVSLLPDLTVEQRGLLEDQVDARLDVSSLIVPVGGIGAYPTMVMRTSDLIWMTEVVAHEWIHNFLTLRPLGIRYDTTPELRTMNETTASIAGKEISAKVIETYYPELMAGDNFVSGLVTDKSQPAGPGSFRQPFDFRKEMHETRVTADQLLAEGKIIEAEEYMEARRQIFWDNGYPLRKLNQAYFAFYGAYADVPGGPAGEDPVGPAVRKLRENSQSLAEFLYQISRMTSFDELLAATGG